MAYDPKDPSTAVVTKRGGVDEWAIYTELIVWMRGIDDEARLSQYIRGMVIRDSFYVWVRPAGKKGAKWAKYKRDDFDSAMTAMTEQLSGFAGGSRRHVEMRGEPLLLQLRPTDIEEIEADMIPGIRYTGGGEFDSLWGKVVDDTKPSVAPAWTV
jgi:hypothetical protein